MKLKLGVLALMLIAAACGGDDAAETTQAPDAAETSTTQAAEAATTTSAAAAGTSADAVRVTTTGLGDIVADGAGNVLYLFVPDAQGASTCYDGCAQAWPPLAGQVTAGDGIDGALLGSVERDDGTSQATYNGWPLYYFASDAAPGDTAGQGANDVWWVVSPAGDAVSG